MGAGLTGLMVLLFLHDWRSVIVVVLNIPFALYAGGPDQRFWLTGQTINLMTLGGLKHSRSASSSTSPPSRLRTSTTRWRAPPQSPARSGQGGNQQTAIPASPGDALRARRVRAVILHAGGGPAQALVRSAWRSPSASRWSRHTCSPAPSCQSCQPGCSATTTTTPLSGRGDLAAFRRPSCITAVAVGQIVRCGLARAIVPAYIAAPRSRSHRGRREDPRPGDLPTRIRRRPVPAPAARARWDADREDRTTGHCRAPHDRTGGRHRDRGDVDRLRGADRVELPHQHDLSVDRRPRGGDPPGRPERRRAG